MPRSLAKTWVQTWGKMDIKETQVDLDQNVLARCAAVALASILNPSGGLFSDAARPCQRPAPPFGANVALENRD